MINLDRRRWVRDWGDYGACVQLKEPQPVLAHRNIPIPTLPTLPGNTGYLGSLCRCMWVDSLVLSSTGKIWCLVELTLSSESVRRLPLPLPLVTKICLRFLLLLLYSREEKMEGFCTQYHVFSYGVGMNNPPTSLPCLASFSCFGVSTSTKKRSISTFYRPCSP